MVHSSTEQFPAETQRAHPPAAQTVVVHHSPGDPAADRAPGDSPAASPRVILVVDDQSSVCTAVAYYLELCGYQTFRAESGQAALEIFGRERIDGVLLDVQMPQMNGFETSKRLQALASGLGRPLKLWFMTAIHYRERQDDCVAAGGLCVFEKPFDWPHLLAELERGLNPARHDPAAPTSAPKPPTQA
jgi:CheY-like chemotaxis protein